MPDLTILLDLPPVDGLAGARVRPTGSRPSPPSSTSGCAPGFLALADAEPERYLVLDATRPAAELSREIQERVRELLPDPVPEAAEEITGSFPVVRD